SGHQQGRGCAGDRRRESFTGFLRERSGADHGRAGARLRVARLSALIGGSMRLPLAFLTMGMMAALRVAAAADAPAPADDGAARAPVNEVAKTTPFTTTIAGKAYRYEATAGTLTIRSDDGKPRASMFYVAYVVPTDKDAPQRPVTFF